MAEFRVECPECQTSYTNKRLGIRNLQDNESADITVLCPVCGKDFDASVQPKFVVITPGFFQRTILRRKPTVAQDGVKVDSTTR